MSIKTSKRIALGVIASLVFAPFAAIAPASAAAITVTTVAGATVTAGSQGTVATLTTLSASLTNADTVDVTLAGPAGGQLQFTNMVLPNVCSVGSTCTLKPIATIANGGAVTGIANIPGKYTLTWAPTSGTVSSTLAVAPAQTNSLQAQILSDSVNGNIYKVGSDNPIIVATRPVGSGGNFVMQVVSSADSGLAPATYFSTTTGQTTIAGASGLSASFTLSTGTGTYDTAGSYEFRVFIDANGNGIFDSSESNQLVNLVLAGNPHRSSVSLDRASLSAADGNVVATVSITDINGNPTYGANTLTPSFTLASGTAAAAGSNALGTLSVSSQASGVAGNTTRVGTTNTYTATVAYTNHIDAIGGSARVTSNIAGTGVTAGFASFVINDTTGATLATLELGSKTGLYTGTAGAAGWTTVIPASTANATASTSNVAVTADVSVTSLSFTVTGTANRFYSITSVLSGTSDTTRITIPTSVRTLADGTAVFSVSNTAPKASATTGSDVIEITVNDTGNTLKARYTISWAPVTAVWTLSPATSFDVLEKSSNTVTATLTDNFARVLSGVAYTVSVSGRNVAAASGVTSATGTASFTVADTATTSYATVGGFPSDIVTFANVATTAIPQATRAVTFTYKATLAAVGTVTVTVAAGNVTVDQIEATPGLPATASRATYTATVRTAAGATVAAGTLVTFAGGADDLFLNGVKTGVTNANGEASVVVYRQKIGNALITATANGVTGSAVAKRWVNDGADRLSNGDLAAGGNDNSDARNIKLSAAQTIVPGSAATVVATVTDRWGNPVSGVLITWSTSGVGRAILGADTTVGTDANGNAQFQVTSLATETGVMTVTALITGGTNQTADLAGFVAGTAVAGVTAGNDDASSTVTFATPPAPVTPEVVVPPVAPTLTGSLERGRVLLFGACEPGEGDLIIYVKSPGKAWQERAKTLECAVGEFDGSLRAPKNTKYYRVKQEGTGLWSGSVLIRR
jgi:hypothetical protein